MRQAKPKRAEQIYMTRIGLKIAYDGTGFYGFQKLPGLRTVEGVLNGALTELCDEEISVIGASRTDSGVHARGNVAVFDTESAIPPERFALALNQRLPKDLRAVASVRLEPDFDPRRIKGIKTYTYRIYNARIEDPLLQRYAHFCPYRLDTDAMREALGVLCGPHDFTSFANPDSQVLRRGGSAVRTIHEAELIRIGNGGFGGGLGELCIRIRGEGFLYHMVRIISGTVLEVGTGARRPSDMETILEKKDRRTAGMTAPAKGLCLETIDYDGECDKRLFV